MGGLLLSSDELGRLLYNATLFTKPKSVMGDAVRIEMNWDSIHITASDDHVIMMDKTDEVTAVKGRKYSKLHFSKKTLKEMLAALPEEPEEIDAADFFSDYTETGDYNPDVLSIIDRMTKEYGVLGSHHEYAWALNRDRLRNLGLLKTPGDTVFPIDFNQSWSQVLERNVVQLKVGPTIKGFIAPLLRGGLTDEVKKGLFE